MLKFNVKEQDRSLVCYIYYILNFLFVVMDNT